MTTDEAWRKKSRRNEDGAPEKYPLCKANGAIYLGTVFILTLSFASNASNVSRKIHLYMYKASTIDRYRSDRSNQTFGAKGVGWGGIGWGGTVRESFTYGNTMKRARMWLPRGGRSKFHCIARANLECVERTPRIRESTILERSPGAKMPIFLAQHCRYAARSRRLRVH